MPDSTAHEIPSVTPAPAAFSLARLRLGKKGALGAFRFLVFFATLVMILSHAGRIPGFPNLPLRLVLLAYLLSLFAPLFLKARWLENQGFLAALFIGDILFVSAGIYLGGIEDVDLFIIFFITIFISAVSQNVASVFAISGVAFVLYAFLHFRSGSGALAFATEEIARCPFLFVAAALSAYIAMEAKQTLAERTRLSELNKILATQADTSVQKLLETNRKLKDLLYYHHNVLSSLPVGIIVVDRKGLVRTFNAGARRITGVVEAEVAGKGLEDFPAYLAPIPNALWRTLEKGEAIVQDHLEIQTARSGALPVTLETSPLRSGNGELTGAIGVIRDVSLLRQMEFQLHRAERLSALGEMAAGVAHEIKNPLNAIQGFANRLEKKLEDPALKKYTGIITGEVSRMDRIVNDVLEFSRPDKAHKAPADPAALVEQVIQLVRERSDAAGIHLEVLKEPSLPMVSMDAAKIRQVLMNLVVNGLQAMVEIPREDRSLKVKVFVDYGLVQDKGGERKEEEVLQQIFLRQRVLVFRVEDQGCGIPREDLAKLFHPFFTTKTTGTGLGLSICQKIVTAHGGDLQVESEVGKGSAFTIRLPLD